MTSIAFVLALTLSAPQSPDVSGTWQLSVTTASGTESGALTLKKDSENYSGTIASPHGETLPVDVTLKEKTITLTINVETPRGPATITFSGVVAGDTMSGTGEFGGRGSGQWTAKRQTAPADVTGTWSLEVTTDQGTGTPSFTFKQDGEKLTGQYRGQFGEAPVTGTIKGADITFAVDVTVEGQTGRITYTGTVEKDTMKGSVSLAGLAQGTFKGVRKPS